MIACLCDVGSYIWSLETLSRRLSALVRPPPPFVPSPPPSILRHRRSIPPPPPPPLHPSLPSKLVAGGEAYGAPSLRLQEPITRAEARASWTPSVAAWPTTPPPGRRSVPRREEPATRVKARRLLGSVRFQSERPRIPS